MAKEPTLTEAELAALAKVNGTQKVVVGVWALDVEQ